jgi:hypothetical protein
MILHNSESAERVADEIAALGAALESTGDSRAGLHIRGNAVAALATIGRVTFRRRSGLGDYAAYLEAPKQPMIAAESRGFWCGS